MPRGPLAPGGEDDLAAAIRDAIGADPDEPVEIVTPQFERRDGVEMDWYPEETMDIYGLTEEDTDTLKDLGLRLWADDLRADDLWLLPAEWYDHIPDGTLLKDINGKVFEFEHGKSDDDRRFGVLPYGIELDLGDR